MSRAEANQILERWKLGDATVSLFTVNLALIATGDLVNVRLAA